MSQQNNSKKGSGRSKLWLPVVVVGGALIGILVYFLTSTEQHFFYRIPFGYEFEYETFRAFHIILSTIGIALLIALIAVYARTYLQTKANFVFGLLVVLFALLLQTLLTYQVFIDMFEPNNIQRATGFPSNFSSPIADIFMIVAYAVFLYLSLE